ncbi:MAG: molybdopterin molybdotransferase MoeA [Thermoleophilia bacterium]|nr:molybdopterin molybdotransferase MoeA [Thermoleophilia bacterium]
MISIAEARALILAEARPLPPERRALTDSLGGVLAEPIAAPHHVPPFDNSAMDGFAVRAVDTAGAGPEHPVALIMRDTIPAGADSWADVGPGEAAKIMTGAALPPGADAVVEVEASEEVGGKVRLFREVVPGTSVRLAGEDVAAGDVVLQPGDPIGPAEIGILASLGFPEVLVCRRPRVAIISTGSELVEVDQPLRPGQIRNSNSYTLEAQCRQLGLEPDRLGIAPDDYEATRALVERGLAYDVLITSGGVSVGEFDFVKDVQDALGVERRLWGVAMKPGKPLAFGVREGCLVFGVPGNPVAAMVSFELFVRPALMRLMGHRRVLRPTHRAVLEEDVANRYGRVHVMRARAWREGDVWHASSTGPQGSGILRSMVKANGLVFIPDDVGVLRAGETADMVLLREEWLEP